MKNRHSRHFGILFGLSIVWSFSAAPQIGEAGQSPLAITSAKTCYTVDPRFTDIIRQQIKDIRTEIGKHKGPDRFVAYISTPISARGGGYRPINQKIAEKAKGLIEARFGGRLWALDPSRYDIRKVEDHDAGAGEYMYMWTEVLLGEDGLGSDFDAFFVVGPREIHEYFRIDATTTDVMGKLDKWVDAYAAEDPDFKKLVADVPNKRREFIGFYALKASAAFSLGAHDEWNLFSQINQTRRSRKTVAIPNQIPVFFDGRSLSTAEMETPISSGGAVPCAQLDR